jgi:hypothetical protein
VSLRNDGTATIELLRAEAPRPRDADEEILDVSYDVRHFAGRVKVMTGDMGIRVRAINEGLDVLFIPEKWRRPDDEDANNSRTRPRAQAALLPDQLDPDPLRSQARGRTSSVCRHWLRQSRTPH